MNAFETNEQASEIKLTPALCRKGRKLLHAQCWAWGRDVRHAEGNLLLRYGFERLRHSEEVSGSSQYTTRWEGLTVRLWGFGIYIGREQGIYMNRFEFQPRTAVLADAWAPEQLSPGARSHDIALLLAFLRWVCSYEQWIDQTQGRAYRKSVLAQFGKLPESPHLASEWLRLEAVIASSVRGAESAEDPNCLIQSDLPQTA
jgi:hypothetical protein